MFACWQLRCRCSGSHRVWCVFSQDTNVHPAQFDSRVFFSSGGQLYASLRASVPASSHAIQPLAAVRDHGRPCNPEQRSRRQRRVAQSVHGPQQSKRRDRLLEAGGCPLAGRTRRVPSRPRVFRGRRKYHPSTSHDLDHLTLTDTPHHCATDPARHLDQRTAPNPVRMLLS